MVNISFIFRTFSVDIGNSFTACCEKILFTLICCKNWHLNMWSKSIKNADELTWANVRKNQSIITLPLWNNVLQLVKISSHRLEQPIIVVYSGSEFLLYSEMWFWHRRRLQENKMWSKTTSTTSTTTLNRVQLNVKTENTHLLCKGKYLCMVDLLFDWFGFNCFFELKL